MRNGRFHNWRMDCVRNIPDNDFESGQGAPLQHQAQWNLRGHVDFFFSTSNVLVEERKSKLAFFKQANNFGREKEFERSS